MSPLLAFLAPATVLVLAVLGAIIFARWPGTVSGRDRPKLTSSSLGRNMARGVSRCLTIKVDQEGDGWWLAEVAELPGVQAHGRSRHDAIYRVEILSLHVLADRLERGDAVPVVKNIFVVMP
jgi:predicted RNase H-like HicB family nuclease